MDRIFIRGLAVEAIIGVHAWERKLPRPLVFDLELGLDLRNAAASDQVRDTIDYQAVADTVAAVVCEREVNLLETLAENVARELFARFPVLNVKLAIAKPAAVSGVKSVGVEIERRREDYAACGR